MSNSLVLVPLTNPPAHCAPSSVAAEAAQQRPLHDAARAGVAQRTRGDGGQSSSRHWAQRLGLCGASQFSRCSSAPPGSGCPDLIGPATPIHDGLALVAHWVPQGSFCPQSHFHIRPYSPEAKQLRPCYMWTLQSPVLKYSALVHYAVTYSD